MLGEVNEIYVVNGSRGKVSLSSINMISKCCEGKIDIE